MMIKITEKCSMGCTHCMNDARPDGRNMDWQTFKDSLKFAIETCKNKVIVITGGEPTEHPDFVKYIEYAMKTYSHIICVITTNGQKLMQMQQDIRNLYVKYEMSVLWQVTYDARYYPKRLDTSQNLFNLPTISVIHALDNITPLGRALSNAIPYNRVYPPCTNARIVARQVHERGYDNVFVNMTNFMQKRDRFCTPHISVTGDIKLGESDLCPACANIYMSLKDIGESVLNFTCDGCHILMTDTVKQVLKEKPDGNIV